MYVCICNAVTEKAIRRLVAQGLHSVEEIQAVTGCAGTCGACHDHASEVVHQALQQHGTRSPVLRFIETSAAQPA